MVDKSVDLLPSVQFQAKHLPAYRWIYGSTWFYQPNFSNQLWDVAGASLAGLGMLGTCNGMGEAPMGSVAL